MITIIRENFRSINSFKLIKENYNEMKFSNIAKRMNNIYIIFGKGNMVDKHNTEDSITAFTEAIEMIPSLVNRNIDFNFKFGGRFGKDIKSQMWNFDGTMENVGHPTNWLSETRGYYAIFGKDLFLFPKDDLFFSTSGNIKDLTLNALGAKRPIGANKP